MGMRAHAQMIPFGLNCRIISLGTHNKMRWFLEDIGAPEWYIDLCDHPEEICERILDKFQRFNESEKESVNQKIIDAQNVLWNITQNNLRAIEADS